MGLGMEGECPCTVRAMNATPFLCLLLSCARDEAVLFFSLVPGLSICEAVAAAGLPLVLLHFCGALVKDQFYCGEVSRCGFRFKASETAFSEVGVGETHLACAAVLTGMLSGSS